MGTTRRDAGGPDRGQPLISSQNLAEHRLPGLRTRGQKPASFGRRLRSGSRTNPRAKAKLTRVRAAMSDGPLRRSISHSRDSFGCASSPGPYHWARGESVAEIEDAYFRGSFDLDGRVEPCLGVGSRVLHGRQAARCSTVSGRAMRKPCSESQPTSRSAASCSSVSTPSATIDDAEMVAELGDHAYERAVAAAGQLLDEGAVDLDLVDGEVLQVGERGVAGAEVVDRHADAEAAQALHLDRRPRAGRRAAPSR